MQSSYTQQPDYETALQESAEDLAPLAIIVQPLGNKFNYPPGYSIHPDSVPQAVLAMTTKFEKTNDQWGWVILDADTKLMLGNRLVDSDQIDTWTYWSQVNYNET